MAKHEDGENGVVNYGGFEGMVLQEGENGHSEAWVGMDLGCVVGVDGIEVIIEKIKERIEAGGERNFGAQLKKHVNRVYLHRAHLQDAVVQLVTLYSKITAPKAQRSVAWRARFSMLDGMSAKVLKLYAMDYMPEEVDNFILTDAVDRLNLITRLTNILAEEKEESVVAAE
jgi:hypothetical protein